MQRNIGPQSGNRPWICGHLLMTSLFYPAVLGGLFLFFLEDCYSLTTDAGRIPLVFAFIGILITFSLDFLYTWISREHYTFALFLSDLAILFFLFNAYRSLLEGLLRHTDITLFYLCLIGIHIICFVWDSFLITREAKPDGIVLYDVTALLLSISGLGLRDNAVSGIIILWVLGLASIFFFGRGILSTINKSSF